MDGVQVNPSNGVYLSTSHPAMKGLTVFTAAVFIAGEMAGSGILALPKAIANAGWAGVAIIIFTCWASVRACLCLSECWMLIEKEWPEYKTRCRDPYPTIADKSIGPWMKKVASITMDISLFGATLVFLLLCADLISLLLSSHINISFCNLIIILGCILCPLTWLGSPQDFSPIAFGAMFSTMISVVIVIAILIKESSSIEHDTASHHTPTIRSFLLGTSTIMFAFGGTVTLPTFQNDMKIKSEFPKAVYLGFSIILLLYLPVAIGGYAIIGDQVNDDVLQSFESGILTTIVNVLMAFHVFCAFLIVINPLNQDIEQQIGIKHGFTFKRTACRTLVTITIIITGLMVPKFGKILNLVGAAIVIPQSFIFPPWFYMKLINKTGENKICGWKKIQLTLIIIISILAMIVATYFSVVDLFSSDSLTKPCFVN